MSNVSGIGDAYYWSVFKIAEAFGLHRDTVKKRLLAANTPVAATVRGNPVYALQHVGPALFSVKHEAADSVHDPSRTGWLANTSTDGNHSHSLSGTAASAGAHAHTVGIGAHTHSVAIGSHGHTITVNAAGNAENTVKNIAFNYIVRLA